MTTKVAPQYSHLSSTEMQVGLEVARVGIGRVDYLKDTVRMDGLSAELFGFPDNVDIPRSEFHSRIHPDDWPVVEREVDILLAPELPDVIDLTHRILQPGGQVRWVNARKRVFFDRAVRPEGPIEGVFAVVDVTEYMRAKEQTNLLIGELNHRTKNLITVVQGISRLLARTVSPEEFPEELNKRLMVLVRNQDAMVKEGAGSFELSELLRSQLAPFDEELTSRVEMTGPRLRLNAAAAQVVGMVVHELATNAVKHGALSKQGGRVSVNWGGELAHSDAALVWKERGGPKVTSPSRRGFGTQVLETLPKLSLEADVAVSYDESGFTYRMSLPDSALAP
ncbi:HWE histidine kinase domain-containing protein [Marivita hallyeonensis]|uniref:histidine kinase n=1 Tax=Marivita hallyeonensis TaxID=996342 RepID=A0A1M5VV92_9RHOB|nr:HWE histidine kinase domain-containing protein [Marivita hallyeonensis]SHH79127.1 Two-component sensor histidine kinase, contains HisKA and HATPase domains [Marivita hallyeonensis]